MSDLARDFTPGGTASGRSGPDGRRGGRPSSLTRFPWGLLLALIPFAAFGQPDVQLRDAASALVRTSHRWEVGARQKFRGEAPQPQLDARQSAVVEGKFEPDGYVEITQAPSREMPVPVTALFFKGDVVARTPLGWKLRGELRQLSGGDRELTFEGKQIRLSRFVAAAMKVTAMRPLSEDLFDLIADLKSVRAGEGSLLIGELRDKTIEQLWGDPQAKRAPEVHGTVIFKVRDGALAEYHVLLGIGFPNSRTKTVAWQMQQWTTRISGFGTTRVELPAEAVRALQQ